MGIAFYIIGAVNLMIALAVLWLHPTPWSLFASAALCTVWSVLSAILSVVARSRTGGTE